MQQVPDILTGASLARMKTWAEGEKGTVSDIANFVLAHPERAVNATIQEFAEQCGTSLASVSRFAQTVGYKRYKDFQLDLAAALASREEPLSGFEEGASPREIIRHVFACNRRSLEDTQRVADPLCIEKAARVIHKARRLYLLGVGASGLVAQQGATRFMSLGLAAQALQDPYLQVFVTSNLSKSDVVVCVSHTGRTRSVVESLQSAAEHGARTVAITNYPQSPLANAAELVLVTSFDEQRTNAAVSSSHIAQLCLLDALYFVIGSWRSRGATALAEVAEDRVQRLLR